MKLMRVTDQPNLVPTDKYEYAKYGFSHFNPVQSRVFEYHDKDANLVVAAPTGVGKTICAELVMGHAVRDGKAMYLVPIKALAQQQFNDWTSPNHSFSKLRVSICTGDYRLTADRKKEIDKADIIIATTEFLNSRSRNFRAESNDFLANVECLVGDEVHLLGEEGRGDHFESGLMKFTEINSDARLTFLSATMSNVDELGTWMSKLNSKDTVVLTSDYRSVPLNIHYVKYEDSQWGYEENEREKIRTAITVLDKHPSDKFILFVHGKKTGTLLYETLTNLGIACEYHNGDIPNAKRVEIENRFRTDPKLRCVIATSTLSQGLNMPARRAVILGVHRGMKEVRGREIMQEAGRTGRKGIDPCGDAYILLPTRGFHRQKTRVETPEPIESQMLDANCLAFHLASEIHHRNVKTLQDIHDWYQRSFAHHQNQSLDDDVVDAVIQKLTRCGAVTEKDDAYDITPVGTISSMFYYSPFDVSDLVRNWNRVFDQNKETDDYWVAMALGNVESKRMDVVSAADKEEIAKFKFRVTECERHFGRDFTDGALKAGCCYYNLIRGLSGATLYTPMRGLLTDGERLTEVLTTIDQMAGRWEKQDYFRRLHLRMIHGVPEEMVEVCQLRGIGRAKAKRLWDANLRTLKDIGDNTIKVIKALNCSQNVAEKICQNAKELTNADRRTTENSR